MKIKTILCTLCAVTVLGSCSYDDDGLWDAGKKEFPHWRNGRRRL